MYLRSSGCRHIQPNQPYLHQKQPIKANSIVDLKPIQNIPINNKKYRQNLNNNQQNNYSSKKHYSSMRK